MDNKYILKAEGISKSFPGVKALDDVHLHIEKGKVHALMGENGAGKSTLMKILIGIYTPDSGQVYFNGAPVTFSSVHDALACGISMIHQELFNFPDLTVAENIFMGKEPVIMNGWINSKKLNEDAALVVKKLGFKIPVTQKMKHLSIADMQMVEIAKAISNKAEVIIMDEPTSALSEKEVSILFDVITDLKKQDIAIIYISHKMDEILRVADTITVMRDGKYITTRATADVTNQELISLIVGRDLNSVFEKRQHIAGETILQVDGLSGIRFKNISFGVKKGEILGIAGLMGSGRTEIVNTIFGMEKATSGTISVNGKPVTIKCPADAINHGIGLISEDRKTFGLVLQLSVKNNITLSSLAKYCKGPFIHVPLENKVAASQIKSCNIKTRSKDTVTRNLSGGNQQKIVIAKTLLNEPGILILDEPTRGIDIGAKMEIYRLILQLANDGKAIIMISSELPEVLGLSDRILVIHDGEIKAELANEEASQEMIMKYAMS